MQSIKEFELLSTVTFDKEVQKMNLKAKGYIKNDNETLILYFKKDNDKYKFFIKDNKIKVLMNDSTYEFELDKITQGIIKSQGLKFISEIKTNKLDINRNSIEISYEMDFNSFKGIYNIKLEYN